MGLGADWRDRAAAPGHGYPATAAAAPFLRQLALDAATPWRDALTAILADLSVGYDEPFAPSGTACAVRDAIRSSTGQLFGRWGTAGAGLDMALVAVSVAFPEQAAPSRRTYATGSPVPRRRFAPPSAWSSPSMA